MTSLSTKNWFDDIFETVQPVTTPGVTKPCNHGNADNGGVSGDGVHGYTVTSDIRGLTHEVLLAENEKRGYSKKDVQENACNSCNHVTCICKPSKDESFESYTKVTPLSHPVTTTPSATPYPDTPEFKDWSRRPFNPVPNETGITALDVIKLLPTGKIDRDQYLKAWQSLKNK